MKFLRAVSFSLIIFTFSQQSRAGTAAENLRDCLALGTEYSDCLDEQRAKEAFENEGNLIGAGSFGFGSNSEQRGSGAKMAGADLGNGDLPSDGKKIPPPAAATTSAALTAKVDENPLVKQCEATMSSADQCCNNPERCFGSGPKTGEGSATDGLLLGGTQAALAIMASMPTGSWSQMCKNMKISGGSMAAINTYLGAQCSKYASSCSSACGASAKSQLSQVEDCTAIPESAAKATCLEKAKELKAVAARLEGYADSCRAYSNRSTAMFSQASSSGLGAALAAKCEEDTGTDTTTDEQLFANPSCGNAAAASNPICRELCSRPGAEVNPKCYGYPGLNSGNNNLGSNNGNAEGLNNKNRFSDSVSDDDEGKQNPNFPDIAAAGKGVNSGNGGGGGAGLGSGGDSGGGSGHGGAGGPSEGYNTKIDRGLSSGGGYSSTGGRLQTGTSGGFSGYGGTGAVTDQGRKFNLKDFLPDKGQNTKLAARLPQSIVAEIGPAHANIFEKITNRFYQVCTRDALYDCSSLKRSKLGN